jgi:hypothetical protein
MNCKKAKRQIQQLLDGRLDSRKECLVQTHLESCAFCARQYEILRSIALSLKALPLYQVNPLFNQKVLAALGRSASRVLLPPWMRGTMAFCLLLISGWMTFLLVEGMAALNVLKIFQALELLLHPSRLSLMIKPAAIKASLALIHFMSTWNEGRMPLGSGFLGPQSVLQIILSSLLAGTLIIVISKNSRSKESGRLA